MNRKTIFNNIFKKQHYFLFNMVFITRFSCINFYRPTVEWYKNFSNMPTFLHFFTHNKIMKTHAMSMIAWFKTLQSCHGAILTWVRLKQIKLLQVLNPLKLFVINIYKRLVKTCLTHIIKERLLKPTGNGSLELS